jgi:hypothetical protein
MRCFANYLPLASATDATTARSRGCSLGRFPPRSSYCCLRAVIRGPRLACLIPDNRLIGTSYTGIVCNCSYAMVGMFALELFWLHLCVSV